MGTLKRHSIGKKIEKENGVLKQSVDCVIMTEDKAIGIKPMERFNEEEYLNHMIHHYPMKSIRKRKGMKFICEVKGDEHILFAQDGHIITTDRVVEIPKEDKK